MSDKACSHQLEAACRPEEALTATLHNMDDHYGIVCQRCNKNPTEYSHKGIPSLGSNTTAVINGLAYPKDGYICGPCADSARIRFR